MMVRVAWRRRAFCFAFTAGFTMVVLAAYVLDSLPWTSKPAPHEAGSTDGKHFADELVQVLEDRIQKFNEDRADWKALTCKNADTVETCYEPGCPGEFSPSPRERVHQILATRFVLPSQYRHVLTSAASNVSSHKYIFVTAASRHYYYLMQALIHNVHTVLFPKMKHLDYTFVLFDLGLTPEQRKLTEKYCRCTVQDFPFQQLPDFMQQLKCYTWKPLIIASLLPKAEYLVWMDTSIRFADTTPLDAIFQRCKERGFQTSHNGGSIAVRTVQTMATFYGDQLCQYSPFDETEANLGFFYNDSFTRQLIIEPWLSCAFDNQCMCIRNHVVYLPCSSTPPRQYGRCHRFDQSSLGIILSKLYLDHRPVVHLPPGHDILVSRDDTMAFFR